MSVLLSTIKTTLRSLPRQFPQQRRPKPFPPRLFPDEQILQVDSRRRGPSTIVMEVQSHACYFVRVIRRNEEGLGVAFGWVGGE